MGLADDWRRLVAALTGRPDTAEEARLAALFQNRSELKKELSALDDERHRLLDRLKLQEGSTMRVEEQLANLEQYLGRPEEAQKCVAYFQLRAVWRLASRRLEQFATELTRQQKDRERKQQLTEFERNRRNRLDDLDREIYDADFGGGTQSAALIQAATRAIGELDAMQDDLADIKRRVDRLKSTAAWRGPGDTIPLQESVGPRDAIGRGSINVLLDDYFDIQKLMLD